MHFNKYFAERDNAALEIRFLRLLAIVLALAAAIEAIAILRIQGSERTLLVPPEIRREAWVTGRSISREYLEEMAYWYAGLALNITPAMADYQNGLFLKYAAPSEYGRLQAEMGSKAEFLRKNATSTQFSVREMRTDDKALKVALSGVLTTWTTDKKAGERNVTYLIRFQFQNGRLHVSDFKETSDQNPFGDPAPGQP